MFLGSRSLAGCDANFYDVGVYIGEARVQVKIKISLHS